MVKTGVEDYRKIERMMESLLLDDAPVTDGLEVDADGDLISIGL